MSWRDSPFACPASTLLAPFVPRTFRGLFARFLRELIDPFSEISLGCKPPERLTNLRTETGWLAGIVNDCGLS